MDLWVVAAAAAAGYLGKYWQNLSSSRDSLSEFSSGDSKCGKPESPTCPIRRLARGKKLREDVSTVRRKKSDGKTSDTYQLDGALAIEATSSSGGSLGNYNDGNALSLSSPPPGFLNNEQLKENEGINGLSVDANDNSSNLSIGEIDGDAFHDSVRNRSSLRSKYPYGRFVKPLNSLESCLVAQLYKEHIKMEEYVLSSLPSPSTPTMRPLLVTDGRRVINRVSGDSFNNKLLKEAYLEKNEYMFGVPPLPKVESLDLPKKIKFKTVKGCGGRLSSSSKTVDGKHFHSQGLHDGTVLFCLGISIGIISSIIANKKEVAKLKELLKQTENLVQDLQEEIEMEDSLTVKELANENYESRGNSSFHDRAPNPFSPQQNMANSTNYYGKESYDEKSGKTSESMSKIEAELEAELERLGFNMNTSRLERRLSDIVELESDFVADFAQGELRADKINGQVVAQPESNQDRSGTSTPRSGNYAVSPCELSLRLHEVIQSRLEEHVEELETALQDSQRKVQLMESERKNPWTKFCENCEPVSPLENLIARQECNSIAQPLVMNLSGEALDAYSEAYEELMKINESEEEDSPSEVYENNHQDGSHLFDKSMLWGRNGFVNGSLPRLMHNEEKTSEEFFSSKLRTTEECSTMVQELLYVGVSEDENSDCDDEKEKQLIKQIVEKTKKGSPVVLNAQRVLFSMDENYY